MRRMLVALLLASCHRAPPASTPNPSFNDRVMALVREYPARSFGGYAWPAPPGTAGRRATSRSTTW